MRNNYHHNSMVNYNLSNDKNREINDPNSQSAIYNYKPMGQRPKTPAWIANHDPDFRAAVEQWGVHPGMLVNAMKTMPVEKVRQSIQYVATMGTNRFGVRGNINEQKGKYLRRVLQNGGIFDYYRQETEAGELR